MRVLLVEDDFVIRELVADIFSHRGHEVSACSSAESAWQLCQEHRFSLCVTDWVLPGMDGLELTRRLQQLGNRRPMVLVMTARQEPGDLAAVLDAGADDYLAKPMDLELLETRLTVAERRVCEMEARLEAEAAAAASERQLLRAQRLDAAGRLAGQVAHDFNNLLAPLAGYPELIKASLPEDHVAAEYCDAMLAAVEQIVQINDELIALSRRGHTEYQPVHLDRLVSAAVAALPPTLDAVPLHLKLAPDLLPVQGSPTQLQRVLVSLLTNAAEAAGPGGEVTVTASNVYLDEPLHRYSQVAVGEYVRLDVHDSGPGIDPEIQDHIFDPFFTTKTTGRRRGAGLGLSVVQAVLEEHRGYVDLDCSLGRGTTFHVYLPISRSPASSPTTGPAPQGTESVLVVDDDPWQRQVPTQLLEDLGYAVVTVASGEAALSYLEAGAPDLLILDMVMPPGLDGTETFRRARAHRPEQRALMVSGYAEAERVEEARALGISGFLRKPVTRPQLARAVRVALDGTRSST